MPLLSLPLSISFSLPLFRTNENEYVRERGNYNEHTAIIIPNEESGNRAFFPCRVAIVVVVVLIVITVIVLVVILAAVQCSRPRCCWCCCWCSLSCVQKRKLFKVNFWPMNKAKFVERGDRQTKLKKYKCVRLKICLAGEGRRFFRSS